MPNVENNLSNDIRWELITASPDMMDTSQGNAQFPFAWRSSLAIYAASPNPEEVSATNCGQKVVYLKITSTITGYQPNREETDDAYVQFPQIPVEDMDEIIKEYFACYGVLLQVAIFPRDENVPVAQYPHIVDFEPKIRDLYQTATENGEILSASKSGVKTDKSFTRTESSETGIDMSSSVKFPLGQSGATGEVGGKLSHKWGDTEKDTWSVAADASRERKETTGMKTEISQMYNLLTGYHAGTNRASFLMLPRPHILQPTDHRTFIQGLRVIEGVQDFFLVVKYQEDLEAFCVEVSLDTGHFPEKVTFEEPEDVYEETTINFLVEKYADNGFFSGDTNNFQETFEAPAPWVVDMEKGDPGHPGVSELQDESNTQARDTLRNYNYTALNDASIGVSGRIKGAALYGPGAIFKRHYRAFLRSPEPIPSSELPFVATPFLITNRRLHTCMAMAEGCFTELPPPHGGYWADDGDWMACEMQLDLDGRLLTKSAQSRSRLPILKQLNSDIEKAMLRNGRLRLRYPYAEVGYLESNYFFQRIVDLLPETGMQTPISDVAEISAEIREQLGDKLSILELIKINHSTFARKTGLNIKDIIDLKRQILQKYTYTKRPG